jgi:diguanylate cyclase (GGDEF)-like protein
MEKKEIILLVDDDKILCEHLKAGLADQDFGVVAVNKGSQAVEELKKHDFSLVITDLILPDIQGIELMRTISKKIPDASFIVLTGYATISSAIEALKGGAYDYIIKPFDLDHLKLVIRRGLEKQRLIVKNKELIERLEKEKYKLEIIMDAYNKIGGIFGLDDLADFVTTKALQIVEAEKASLLVVDENSGELVLKGAKGIGKDNVALRIKIGELIAGWVAKQGEALLVSDIDSDPRFKFPAKTGRYKTKSFISLPLKMDSQVIGVMNVTDKLAEIKVFTEEDLKYLTLVAHQTVTQIENIRLCEKLASLAITDALTNLFNHRYFQEELNTEILRAQRYKHALSMMIFDIDFFKTYNDRYGHLEGDRVIKQVAALIKQNVRQVDMVCRYGGDEFVVILPFTNLKGARFVAEKIRQSVEEQDLFNKETRKVIRATLSGGIATYREGMTKDELIAAADRALYRAKAEGRNKIYITE